MPEAEHAAFQRDLVRTLGSPARSGMTTRMKLRGIATNARRTTRHPSTPICHLTSLGSMSR